MAFKIITTGDGSHSILLEGSGLTYHSRYGALAESEHVFIQSGLKEILSKRKVISVFEMGFGTGLNALLTYMETEMQEIKVKYETTDIAKLDEKMVNQLNYPAILQRNELKEVLYQLHFSPWDQEVEISRRFHLFRHVNDIRDISFQSAFDLVYYDAFDPAAQPELWTAEMFSKLFAAMKSGGILVTYSSKGIVRRALTEAGFRVEKLPGPKGKREIVRAWT